MPRDTLMRAALSLADRGMAVFPVLPGTKRPAVRRDWEGCATTDVDQIERWWHRAPYNIGVATGPSRLVVVDLDAPHGSEGGARHGRHVLGDLARDAGAEIPRETFTVVTPGGGQHLYFRAPADCTLTNTAGRLGPLIDTRATGGYVVGPGSMIDGRAYRLVRRADPAALPSWIRAGLRMRLPDLPAGGAAASTVYVDAAVRNEARRVAEAAPGRRNIVLFQAAARLARFVPEGRITDDDIRRSLTSAASRHISVERFSAREIARTVDSGLRRGRADARGSRTASGRVGRPTRCSPPGPS